MIQQQRFGTSMTEAASRIVQERGVLTLLRGLETSCGREGLFAAGYLGLGPVFADYLRSNYGMGGGADFAGAAGAGMIAATLSHPLDTIKTCMQGDIERQTYTTFSGTASTLMGQGGYGQFFKGWGFRTTRMICAIWLIGRVKNTLGPLIFPHAVRNESDDAKPNRESARTGVKPSLHIHPADCVWRREVCAVARVCVCGWLAWKAKARAAQVLMSECEMCDAHACVGLLFIVPTSVRKICEEGRGGVFESLHELNSSTL